MASNGCCYLDACNGVVNGDYEDTSNGLDSPPPSTVTMAMAGITVAAASGITKQLFSRREVGLDMDDKMAGSTDCDIDVECDLKALNNNNNSMMDNNISGGAIGGVAISPSSTDTETITNCSNCSISSSSSTNSSPVASDNNNNSRSDTANDDNSMSGNGIVRRKLMFAVGQDVLARWNDGLFYLGNILKIDENSRKCFVRFEDDSEFWVMFKDIQRGAKEGEIMCCSCQGESSDAPDEIVLCDNCGLGYHQLCHNPSIDTQVLNPDVEWLCRLCVFASTVKRGGALKSGPNAQALQLMKQSLPYDMNVLTWDAQHKTNIEQCYCYCGGPGDWYLKMLQCCRCRMWFHEACIQCLDQPLLCGDRFYLFACSFCNSGPEYIKRIQLKWVDVAQLALFNLCIGHHKKYYDLDKVIMPWVYMNWQNLQLDMPETHLRSEGKEKILETLRSHKKRFQCGREIKKSRSLWGLRLRLPPSPPNIDLPIEGQITDDVMSNLQMQARKTKTFAPVECQSPVRLKRKASVEPDEPLIVKSKKPTVNGTKGTYRRRNRVKRCTLDTIIPPLPSFDGLNHPFITGLEQKIEREKLKLKQKILDFYQNGFDQEKFDQLTEELKAFNQQKKTPLKQKGRRKVNSLKLRPPMPPGTLNLDSTMCLPKNSCSTKNNLKQMQSTVSDYLSVVNKIAKKETFHVLARRFVPQGQLQYLVEWDGMLS